MVIRDVQHHLSPPRGLLHLGRRQDTSARVVKEEPEEDVEQEILAGFVVPSS